MRLLKVGERITLKGRAFEVAGLTAMSARQKRVFLRELETGEQFDVEETAQQHWRVRPSGTRTKRPDPTAREPGKGDCEQVARAHRQRC
jgi:hypothetical protein